MACLCLLSSRYPSHYVYSSEHSTSGPAQSAGDTDPEAPSRTLGRAQEGQDSAQHKVGPGRQTAFMYIGMTTTHMATPLQVNVVQCTLLLSAVMIIITSDQSLFVGVCFENL